MASEKHTTDILLSILEIGLLRIRALGAAGRSEECQKEADHLHNIPSLVRSFDWDRLLYYCDSERTAFLATTSCSTEQFGAAWEELMHAIPGDRGQTAEGPGSDRHHAL
jgi:hypothetical protein